MSLYVSVCLSAHLRVCMCVSDRGVRIWRNVYAVFFL